jgi:hypothetical protein
MSAVDVIARMCVAAAARRWPDDLSQTMYAEWCAELEALRADTAVGSFARSRRAVAFGTSLLLSPAVEAVDAAPRTRRDHRAGPVRALTALSAVAGVTVLAAALSNVVHDAGHAVGQAVSPAVRTWTGITMLVAAAGTMWMVGALAARRGRLRLTARPATAAIGGTVAVGVAMYAFLLAGNRVAVMPFMGWVDLAPGIGAWMVLTAAAAGVAARVAASGRRRLGALTGAAGAVAALEAAAIGGSLHAAGELGVGLRSAPAWFPLALLPGDTVSFGRFFADGTASFGVLRRSGPAFHASDILLGNASAMVVPLVLCSAFLIAYAVHSAGRSAGTAPAADRSSPRWTGARTVAAGLGLAAVATWTYLAVHSFDPTAVPGRIEDNSVVFGFGFAAHPAGRAALTIVLGVLAARFAVTPDAAGAPPTPDGHR